MINYLLVALGSAVGGMARFGCANLTARWFGVTFPWGTLLVNIAGSLLIGVLFAMIPIDGRNWLTDDARAFLMIGLCGGFTTFSAFSIETFTMLRNGDWGWATVYVGSSLVACLAAVSLGYFAGMAMQR